MKCRQRKSALPIHYTGHLAKLFDTEDLAHGIPWVLAQRAIGTSGRLLGQQARERAKARSSAPVVAAQYRAVYANAVC